MKMKIYALVSIIVISVLAMVIAQNQNTLKIFKAGDVIKAEDVNANFAALQAEIATLRSQIGNSNPSSNGYLGKFTQVIKQSDNFVCIPLFKDWKWTGCENGKPINAGFGKNSALYLDNPLINNKPDVTIIAQRNISKTTYAQEFKDDGNYSNQKVLEGYRYNGNIVYNSAMGKWYLMVKNPSTFLNCREDRSTNTLVCSDIAFDFLVFE